MNRVFDHIVMKFIIFSAYMCFFYGMEIEMDEYTFEKIKKTLGTTVMNSTTSVASTTINQEGVFCTSIGETFRTDSGFVFIKNIDHSNAKLIYQSEFKSLQAIEQTNTIKVPHPIAIVEGSKNKFYFIMENVDMERGIQKQYEDFAQKLAMLHLHNEKIAKFNSSMQYVNKFGFFQSTVIELLPISNNWTEDWPTFYCNWLDEQIQRIGSEEQEVVISWKKLKPLIPKFFADIKVRPSLLHGYLVDVNIGETTKEAIIFDPSSIYGHYEFDLAMTSINKRLSSIFYDIYYRFIPRENGFQTRETLYHLFHSLVSWNNFGSGHKRQTMVLFEKLLKVQFPLVD